MTENKHFTIFFVHGINTSEDELPALKKRMTSLLDVASSYSPHKWTYDLRITSWASQGDFFKDLLAFSKDKDAFRKAVKSVSDQIQPYLGKNNVVIGHSMGQLIGACATHHLTDGYVQLFVSLGGPLANTSLSVRTYVDRLVAFYTPLSKITKFVDVWNNHDPICTNFLHHAFKLPSPALILRHFVSIFKLPYDTKLITDRLYHKNLTSFQLDYPGVPSVKDPLAEHSAYFLSDDVALLISKELTGLCQT